MQKAQPSELAGTGKSRYSGYLEIWKKVADRKAHLIFASLPLRGPGMTDELKKAAVGQIHRLTWPEACQGVSDEERVAVWRANQDAMDRHASELVDKVVAEQCTLTGP